MSTTVGIIYKNQYEPARMEAEKLKRHLNEQGVVVFCEEMSAPSGLSGSPGEPMETANKVDWVVVLGGDGTLLGAARNIGKHGTPILGVNLGGLGFLTSIPLRRLYPVIEMMLKGKLEVESRLMLETKVLRMEDEICRFSVLNDVVINKGPLARIIDLDAYINETFLTTFRADGLIVSTPTGSTGYNLAAGGPVLYPTMTSFVLTPICPFTISNRPIILPDSDTISIKMGKESEEKVTLTLDGQVGFEFEYGDKVMIYKSNDRIKLIRSPDQSYFEILREKLMWGGATHTSASHHHS